MCQTNVGVFGLEDSVHPFLMLLSNMLNQRLYQHLDVELETRRETLIPCHLEKQMIMKCFVLYLLHTEQFLAAISGALSGFTCRLSYIEGYHLFSGKR